MVDVEDETNPIEVVGCASTRSVKLERTEAATTRERETEKKGNCKIEGKRVCAKCVCVKEREREREEERERGREREWERERGRERER
jgi:hypothetical protein